MFPWDLRLHCPSVNSVNTWPPPRTPGWWGRCPCPEDRAAQADERLWVWSPCTRTQSCIGAVCTVLCAAGARRRKALFPDREGSWEESIGQYRSSQVPSCSLRACWSFAPSEESRFLKVAYRSLPRVPSALPLIPRRPTEVKWALRSHATHARWKRCQWALVLRPP